MSHDPDEISRTFKKHCSKCDTIPISVLTAVTNSALNAASVFPSRRIEISDSHTDLNRSADTCRSRPAGFGRPGRGRLDGHDLRRATLASSAPPLNLSAR